MTEQAWIHEVVERVASEVMERHVAEMREELVRQTVEEVQPSLASSHGPRGGSEKLLAAVAQVQANVGQRDILNTLVEQSAGFCARSVLFVVQQDATTAWQAIGFADDEAVREFTFDGNTELLQQVMGRRAPATGDTAQRDTNFLNAFGAPVNGECHLMPLFLKDKVAAVLYADAGTANASCERASLDLLVRFTSLWLDAQAARKAANAQGELGQGQAEAVSAPAPAAQASSTGGSAHAPEWSRAASASSAAAPAMAPAIEVPVAVQTPVQSSVQPVAPETSAPEMSAADADTHKRAHRFARLLIDEIKLYNKAKVEDGLKSRDLYDRMRDDIDKSRATYVKRYGHTVAASADYFVQELIRGLAQGDASALGNNFQH